MKLLLPTAGNHSFEAGHWRHEINMASTCCGTVAFLIDSPRIMFCRLVTFELAIGVGGDDARVVLLRRTIRGLGDPTTGKFVQSKPETNGRHMAPETEKREAVSLDSPVVCAHCVRTVQSFMSCSEGLTVHNGSIVPIFGDSPRA